MSTPDDREDQGPRTPEEAQKEFERLFAELVDVLQTTVDNMEQTPERLPEDLEAKLADLEKQVAHFQALGASIAENSEPTPKQIDLSKLTIQELACVERSEQLLKEAAEKQKLFPQEPSPQTEFNDEKERRKHFKRLGRKKI